MTTNYHHSNADKITSYLNSDSREDLSDPKGADKHKHEKPIAAPGPKKKRMMASRDREDRTMELERENNALKEKENLLQLEIKSMQTKLRRIEELINQRSRMGGDGPMDLIGIQNDLQHECDKLKTENEDTKEKVRKLTVIQRGLATRPAGAPAKADKFAHVQGKLQVTQTASMKRMTDEADDIRAQLVANNRKKIEMEHQLEVLRRQNKGLGGPADAKKLRDEIQEMLQEQRSVESEMVLLQHDQKAREQMFKDSKNFVAEIQTKLRDATAKNLKLKYEVDRLQDQTQQVTSYEKELLQFEKERDALELSIKSILAEPFKQKKDGNTIEARIAELSSRLVEKEKKAKDSGAERRKNEETLEKLRKEVTQLKHEKSIREVDYNTAKEDFEREHGNKGLTEADAVKGLIQMDANKYAHTLTDLVMGGDATWKGLDFLERDRENADKPQGIKHEIQCLTQEKADLANELEQAQKLLKLQTDIQRENDTFFQKEIERLTLVDQAATSKLQELSRRVDEKQRSIMEAQKKLDIEKAKMGSPMKTHQAGADGDLRDSISEFSVATNETEIQLDENILDFKIEDAQFIVQNFSQAAAISNFKEGQGAQFVTLLTVDFFNCPSETTGLQTGYKPTYNTQISFKNRVDKFYLDNLERGHIKIDVYVSSKNAALHVGSSLIPLKKLLVSEYQLNENQSKTASICDYAEVKPLLADDSLAVDKKEIALIRYRMRLRKPIMESWKYNRDRRDIETMTSAKQFNQMTGSTRVPKKHITIEVIGCDNLDVPYGKSRQMAPFFFYQFFTFDDRYSKNGEGGNPKFHDVFSYEVEFDAKTRAYFERESLEIILFDDNFPIQGKGMDGQADENGDMIGVARIPLKAIAQNISVHDKFPIMAPKTSSKVGTIEVKLSVMDLDLLARESIRGDVVTTMHFNKEWERDVLRKIAAKLAGATCEPKLIFGVFSNGQKSCTKEDFIYTCRVRLGLRNQITEKEMAMFVDEVFKGHDYITHELFVDRFEAEIISARHNLAEQAALNLRTQRSVIGRTLTQSQMHDLETNLHWRELRQSLGNMIKGGHAVSVMREFSSQHDISHSAAQRILTNNGTLSAIDAHKVIENAQISADRVDCKKLETIIEFVRDACSASSEAISKVKAAIEKNAKDAIYQMEKKDINGDGMLLVDGFLAALMQSGFRLTAEDLKEAFYLSCLWNGELRYHSWLRGLNQQFEVHFTKEPKQQESVLVHNESMASIKDTSSTVYNSYVDLQGKAASAKIKFENFIRSEGLSLGGVFTLIDSNTSNSISFSEFRSKIKMLHMHLDDEEIMALFKSIDINNSKTIAYDELIDFFRNLNIQQLIAKLKKFTESGKADLAFMFDRHAKGANGRMSVGEFTQMVKEFIPKVTQAEITQMYKHFDKTGRNFITQSDWLSAFTTEIKDQVFSVQIEDIIKPLKTKLRVFHLTPSELFDKADENRSFSVDAQELAHALSQATGGQQKMDANEVKLIEEYFVNSLNKKQINRAEFIKLFETEFVNKFDEAEARKALQSIKTKCDQDKIDILKFTREHNPEGSSKINIRSFKLAVHELHCLTLYGIDNLAKYLDVDNEGYITMQSFASQVHNTFSDTMSRKASTKKLSPRLDKKETGRSSKWTGTNH